MTAMAAVAAETVHRSVSIHLVFQNTENKVLITCLKFSSGNSKRLTGSDIHHEGDEGKGKEQNYSVDQNISECTCVRVS